jgi:hypothetical protein
MTPFLLSKDKITTDKEAACTLLLTVYCQQIILSHLFHLTVADNCEGHSSVVARYWI